MKHFDVFLSYKQTDEQGNATPEVAVAESVYSLLTSKGIPTFYSKQTIGILGEARYKAAIDDALDEATVLITIGSSVENLNSNWVRYEWDSFYNDVLSGRKNGQVISLVKNIDTNNLPRTLRQLKSFNKWADDIDAVCNFAVTALENRKPKTKVQKDKLKIVSLKELEAKGVSALNVAKAITENDKFLYASIPAECAGTAEQWAAHFGKFPDFCAFIIDEENNILGNYSFAGLTDDQEKLMKNGEFKDCLLDPNTGDNLYVCGNHNAYLLNLSVNPIVESAEFYHLLWNSFIEMLKTSAEEGIYFNKIYYKAFLPEHEAKVAARGFRFCCTDKLYGKVFVHDMDSQASLRILDSGLAEVYAARKSIHKLETKESYEALSAYMDFWKQIEELFYHSKFRRLKKYFMGNDELPQNSAEHDLGLVVALWLRDIMQYSSALLPFLPEEQRKTHREFESNLLNSALIKESMGQYRFSTETEKMSVDLKTDNVSVKSIVTFAKIWLDLSRLYMQPEVISLRPYFYEKKSELPPSEYLELCEGLAVRILTAMLISENHLHDLPDEFVDSYLDYKAEMISSRMAEHIFKKYPFLEKELTDE